MTIIIDEFKYENIYQMLNLQSKNNSKAYIQDWIMTFWGPLRLMILWGAHQAKPPCKIDHIRLEQFLLVI